MSLGAFHQARGVVWGREGEAEVPWSYGNVEEELEALYQGAALLDFSEQGLLELRGADRTEFLHNQCTSDIRGMPKESWFETLFLNAKGQIEHLGRVFHLGEALWVSSPSAQALAQRFHRYIVFDQVEVESLPRALLRLQGPQAEAVGQQLFPLPPRWGLSRTPGGVVARDELGLWLLLPLPEAAVLAPRLLEHGATPVGRQAWHIWRVERGQPDLAEALGELPQEVGLGSRVNYKKGCYLGQEIMARLEARGQTRYHLMALLGQVQIPPGAEVFREGRPVGRVGTAVESPEWGAVALALLRKELRPGDQVRVGDWSATVAGLPLE
ncbi:Aminomethyltransferase [Meiothermus luteus]|jgi:folate-binding protein YgfZ|uniref:Aminomethyltransferase n=1 Tax=Meiothermus luteus TaxID=2026184 RepID=A0A399F0B2_9DEIN|nr:folate-binding protein YgfZ [Meiothermus luteus]RIH88749.1 Aminomethyltransferase [Meiothermus luteus]RMH54472.1 MAG: folate-binding protein [Deinococcota bacterium]